MLFADVIILELASIAGWSKASMMSPNVQLALAPVWLHNLNFLTLPGQATSSCGLNKLKYTSSRSKSLLKAFTDNDGDTKAVGALLTLLKMPWNADTRLAASAAAVNVPPP